jgi:hypothetical protein
MIEIQPQLVTFSGLLHGRLFRIPEYQRAYSWRFEHRDDLFEDIRRTRLAGNENNHFMSTIVGLRREKRTIITDEHQVIEIVDGQQRITTLIILLKSIAKAIDRSKVIGRKIGKEIDETLVKPDKASLLLLQTNHDSSQYFADYLRTGNHPSSETAKTIADRELLQAMEECEKFTINWQASGASLVELVSLLKNRLTFVLYEISDEALVYTVFEVLNSRGLDVAWVDRLKSMLMAIIFDSKTGNKKEIINEVHQLWTDIYRCMGLRLGMSTESLRFAASLREKNAPSRPLSEENAARLLQELSVGGPAKVLEMTKWVKTVTEAIDHLTSDRRKNAVTRIGQARLLAVAIILRTDLSRDEKERILRRWENITFRIYGMFGRDARYAVGDYFRLAWRVYNEKPSARRILEDLSSIGADFPITKAVNELQETNCYKDWQEELRYFLYRYEEYLAVKAKQKFDNEQWNRIWLSSAADSIEHIKPQSSTDSEWVHWLGNLLVLPPKLNSKLGATPPQKKAGEYTKTGLLIAQKVVNRLPKWQRSSIKDREKELLEWAVKEWAD